MAPRSDKMPRSPRGAAAAANGRFDLPDDNGKKPTHAPIGVRAWLPSLVTLVALGCGQTAARIAEDGDWDRTTQFLLAAMVADGVDGHVARALGVVTAFGGELDSLCDLANFGVAPAFITYHYAKQASSAR